MLGRQMALDFARQGVRVNVVCPGWIDTPFNDPATVIRQWAGMYDVSPDHLPLVGATQQLGGWWQANGWSGRGMLLAPYLAELLATQVASGHRHERLQMFDPDRFAPDVATAESAHDYYARYAAR